MSNFTLIIGFLFRSEKPAIYLETQQWNVDEFFCNKMFQRGKYWQEKLLLLIAIPEYKKTSMAVSLVGHNNVKTDPRRRRRRTEFYVWQLILSSVWQTERACHWNIFNEELVVKSVTWRRKTLEILDECDIVCVTTQSRGLKQSLSILFQMHLNGNLTEWIN